MDDIAALCEQLEVLGFTPREARAYTALLPRPKTAAEVADEISASAEPVAELLEDLTRRGFLSRIPGVETRYGLAPPERTLPPLVRRKEAELDRSREAIELIGDRYRSTGGAVPEAYVEVVAGAEAAMAQIWGLQSAARSEVLGFVKAPFFSMENAGEQESLARRVSNRWLWERAAFDLPGMIEIARSYHDAGEQIRVVPEVPSKLVIIDRQVAVIHIREATPGGSIVGALSTRHPELVATFLQLFELLWEDGISPFSHAPGADDPEASAAETERLVTCLAAGMTDTAIARDLKVSRRTLTRRIQELMDSLNVETRFQAGFRLGQEAGREAG
ncbi:MAG: hypothetical protein M3290_05490 [Actinomycetota bacterium]|nr:hypothetical protein [Actinomycetota bacterium]